MMVTMEQFKILIADRVVGVSALFASSKECCSDYLCDAEADFSVEISSDDIAFEEVLTEQERATEGLPYRKMEKFLLERTALQRKIAEKLFEFNTLLFHGSVIAVNGEGYLFTAKSGTGKSTHTRLWREMLGDRAIMVNDDKPFLNVINDGVRVYGSPWNGKHGIGNNINVPLKAICILERGEYNEISRITAKEAVPMLLQQSNRPMQSRLLPKYLDLLEKIAENTAFYRLKCNMEPQAAMISYQTMSGDVKEKLYET
jgi:hypothetical protein